MRRRRALRGEKASARFACIYLYLSEEWKEKALKSQNFIDDWSSSEMMKIEKWWNRYEFETGLTSKKLTHVQFYSSRSRGGTFWGRLGPRRTSICPSIFRSRLRIVSSLFKGVVNVVFTDYRVELKLKTENWAFHQNMQTYFVHAAYGLVTHNNNGATCRPDFSLVHEAGFYPIIRFLSYRRLRIKFVDHFWQHYERQYN